MEWNKIYRTTKLPKDKKFLVLWQDEVCIANWEEDYEQFSLESEFVDNVNRTDLFNKEEFDYYILIPNQPERSKREDSQKCEMRCSEHCGNTVREAQ